LPASNALTKLVPDRGGIVLKRVFHAPLHGEKSLVEQEGLGPDDIENVKKLREIYNNEKSLEGIVLHEAERLEGSVRNTGVHAAGIIIAPKDLTELIPVCTSKESTLWLTQIAGNIIEDAGVIKMDILGIKTLTIIKNALEIIKENHAVEIDIDAIPLDDKKTFELYQHADTIGTFQFEGQGMQKYLRELKPDKFDDLIAMNALYRPGPMAYIPSYIERKHGREEVRYDLPEMEEILKDSYGVTVYQEQVMLLAQKIAGFSKGDADVLRKAMGKKQKSTLDKMKNQFIRNASARGLAPEKLEKIWTDWEAFAQYGFNKAHSTCYAYLAYQTAYLKAHYPAEYMSAVLNNAGSIDKITFFMEECKRMGIKVLGTDINESLKGFAVNKDGEIRFGLDGLKGVGEAAVSNIIEERKTNGLFENIFDFIKRINQRNVSKKTLESLAYAGAFDCFPQLHRAQYFFSTDEERITGLERIIRFGNQFQNYSANTTNTLFGDLPLVMDIQFPKIPDCPPWPLIVQLDHEKEVTGMFLSGHPLDNYKFEMKHYGITSLLEFNEFKEAVVLHPNPNRLFRLIGLVADAQHKISRQGNKYGTFIIEDYSGKTDLVLWSEDYVKYANYLQQGSTIFITGFFRQRWNKEEYEFKIQSMSLIEGIKRNLTRQVQIEVHPSDITDDMIKFVEQNVKSFPGKASLKFTLNEPKNNWKVSLLTMDNGFEMNDEMAEFLQNQPMLGVQVTSS
jgi:DNA polymerase-3 subunit alpha